MSTGPGDAAESPGQSAATKRAPTRNDEGSGGSTSLDRETFDLLTPSAQQALAHAQRLAELAGASRIHVDHLIIGLYREPDGPTQRLFADARLSTADLAGILEGISEDIVPDPPLVVHDLETPPLISRHVALAFEAARRIAAESFNADAGLPWIQSRHLLFGVLSVERCTVTRALRRAGVDKSKIVLDAPEPGSPDEDAVDLDLASVIAGVRSDEAIGPDLLDIGREVDALGRIIAARDVQPPIAIGLFGDWGTGKTFFMRRLQRRIRAIQKSERARDPARGKPVYCRDIVQLEFNAWHYIDENLWASLASAIFDGLDESLTKADKSREALKQDEVVRAQILTDKAAAQHDLSIAEEARAEADRRLKASDARLDVLAKGAASPVEIVAGAWAAANRDEATKAAAGRATESIRQAAADLHLDPDVVTRDLRRGTLGGRLAVAFHAWTYGWRTWLPIAAGALAIVVVLGIAAPQLSRVALAVPALIALVPLGDALRRSWGVIGAARDAYQAIIDRDQTAAERERTDALARVAKAQGEIDAAHRRLVDADTRLEEMRPVRQLANFVSGRHASSDYRSRLGVVAQARDDFEQLTRLIAEAGSAPARATADGVAADGAFLPSIDRIVLYIDDLDRCREKEVVDVLQAVHLLLAFRLFVVVVAVDPRWLVHSLRVHSRVFQERRGPAASNDGAIEEDEGPEWQTTPLNYLEKIFQVPFAIRPMGKSGFEAMIHDLVRPVDTNGGTLATSIPDRTVGPGKENGVGAGAETAEGPIRPDGAHAGHATDNPDEPAEDEDDTAPVDLSGDFLEISDVERDFMGRLHPLVVTPRAAKRFVNVYRILKASVDPKRRPLLDEEGPQQAVLLMLAMLTSHPTETTPILQALVSPAVATDVWTLIDTVRDGERMLVREAAGKPPPGPDDEEEDDGWRALGDKLARVKSHVASTDTRPFGEWARDVSRFSFESSRVLLTPVEEPGAQEHPIATA